MNWYSCTCKSLKYCYAEKRLQQRSTVNIRIWYKKEQFSRRVGSLQPSGAPTLFTGRLGPARRTATDARHVVARASIEASASLRALSAEQAFCTFCTVRNKHMPYIGQTSTLPGFQINHPHTCGTVHQTLNYFHKTASQNIQNYL